MLSSSLLSTSSSMACCSPFIVVGAGAGTVAVAVAVAVVLLALFIARLLIVPSLLSSSSSFAPSFLRSFAVVPSVTSADCNGNNSQRPTNGRQTTNERRRSVRTAFLHSTSKNQRPKTHKPQHSVQFSIFIQFPFFTLHSFTLRNPNFKNNRKCGISQFRNFAISQFRIPTLHSSFTTYNKDQKEKGNIENGK